MQKSVKIKCTILLWYVFVIFHIAEIVIPEEYEEQLKLDTGFQGKIKHSPVLI
jgi:hypothetical protein